MLILDVYLIYMQDLSQKGVYEEEDGSLGYLILEYDFFCVLFFELIWVDLYRSWLWYYKFECQRLYLQRKGQNVV